MHVYSTLIGGLIASLTSAKLCKNKGGKQCKKDDLCKWKKAKGACTFKSENKIRNILKARTESSYADRLTDGRGYSETEAPTEPPTEPPTEDPECYEYDGHNCCPIPPEPCKSVCTYRDGSDEPSDKQGGTMKNCLSGGSRPWDNEDRPWFVHDSNWDEDDNYRFYYHVHCETNNDCCAGGGWGDSPAIPCPTGKNGECCGWNFDKERKGHYGTPIPCPF